MSLLSKVQYKEKLRSIGYRIEGDRAYLDTKFGPWVQQIVEDKNGMGLITIHLPTMSK